MLWAEQGDDECKFERLQKPNNQWLVWYKEEHQPELAQWHLLHIGSGQQCQRESGDAVDG